jgi:ABC-type multidrug transport system permease subunit
MPQIKVEGIDMVTPNYWALEGIQNVISRGMGMEGLLVPAGIPLGMAALFFIIGAARFRTE